MDFYWEQYNSDAKLRKMFQHILWLLIDVCVLGGTENSPVKHIILKKIFRTKSGLFGTIIIYATSNKWKKKLKTFIKME